MEINKFEKKYFLNQNQINKFWRDGWYVSPVILNEEEIIKLIKASEEYYQGKLDRKLKIVPPNAAYWRPEDGDGFRMNDYINYEKNEFDTLARHPIISNIAAQLLGVNKLRLFGTSLTYKPPNKKNTNVGWHTDKAYWQTCTSYQMITAWVPFHDCNENNGSLTVVDGSHWWCEPEKIGPLEDSHFLEIKKQNLQIKNNSLDEVNDSVEHFMRLNNEKLENNLIRKAAGRPIQKKVLRLKKGQVSFHHCLTYHGSGSNQSKSPRRACSLHYQCGNNQYKTHKLKSGKYLKYNTDHLCRKIDGKPDYQDPEYFPLVASLMQDEFR